MVVLFLVLDRHICLDIIGGIDSGELTIGRLWLPILCHDAYG